MTLISLMDGVAGRPGPGSSTPSGVPPASPFTYSGPFIPGLAFEVTQGGMWLAGYRCWVTPSGMSTAPVKCALWSATGGGGTLVPDSVLTSGTLTAGAMNTIMLPEADWVPIAIGTPYIAALGVNQSFPTTHSQFDVGDPYSGGITNGPVRAYSGPSGSLPAPYSLWQCVFDATGTDPSVTIPLGHDGSGDGTSNFWVDVVISDTAPAGYGGTYRLWPNKFDASPTTNLDTNLPFTLANEVHYSQRVTSSWLWFYSVANAASLPSWAGVYPAAGGAPVAANTSPSWRTPDGSQAAAAGGGWCKCALAVTLAAGQYKAAVYNVSGSQGIVGWSPTEYGYFLTGAGSAGIRNGPAFAPPNGSAAAAHVYTSNAATTPPYWQGTIEPANGSFARDDSVTSGAPQYPYLAADYTLDPGTPTGAIAESFWVDLEVTPAAATGGGGNPLLVMGIA